MSVQRTKDFLITLPKTIVNFFSNQPIILVHSKFFVSLLIFFFCFFFFSHSFYIFLSILLISHSVGPSICPSVGLLVGPLVGHAVRIHTERQFNFRYRPCPPMRDWHRFLVAKCNPIRGFVRRSVGPSRVSQKQRIQGILSKFLKIPQSLLHFAIIVDCRGHC